VKTGLETPVAITLQAMDPENDSLSYVVVSGHLTFWAKVRSFESSDKARVRVSPDGTSFTTILTVTSADSDNTYRSYAIDLSGFTMTTTFTIAFDAEMSSTGDEWFVDNIQVTGVR
jgi:hypothetical protein